VSTSQDQPQVADVVGAPPGPSDAELISSSRRGDRAAFDELYRRHAPAATAVARQYVARAADAEDAVAEAFARIFRLFGEGRGPDTFFRAYLFTTVRRISADLREGLRQGRSIDDEAEMLGELPDESAPTPEDLADRDMVRGAFAGLPERWRSVLWYAEVEGMTPAQMALPLGLTPNATAALLYRAREGLRQAFLNQHLAQPLDPTCRGVSAHIAGWARGALGQRERGRVDAHLADCAACRTAANEIKDVNHALRSVIAPLVLGAAGLPAILEALSQAVPVAAGQAAAGLAASAGAQAGATAGAGGATGAGGHAALAGAAATGGKVTLGTKLAAAVTALAVAGGAVIYTVTSGSSRPSGDDPAAPGVSATASAGQRIVPIPNGRVHPPGGGAVESSLRAVFALEAPGAGAIEIGSALPTCGAAEACDASSGAQLVLPERAEVQYALLEWAAEAPGTGWNAAVLTGPDGVAHAVTGRPTPPSVSVAPEEASTTAAVAGAVSTDPTAAPLMFADVTALVAASGSGTWRLDSVKLAGESAWAGWAIAVTYWLPDTAVVNRATVYAGAVPVTRDLDQNLPVALPDGRATRLGFATWGALAPLGGGVWMLDASSDAGIAQRLWDRGFAGRAAGGEFQSRGTDVFALDREVVFPSNPAGGTEEAISFRASAGGKGDVFTIGLVTVVAPFA
jgi:RNA polymerase sigma factor (sigma-70 family)